MIGKLLDLCVPLSNKGCNTTATGSYLLDITDNLLIKMVAGCDDKDRHFAVDERNGPVLHLGCRITFGMNIGNLLQFQGTFKGQRIVVATSQIEAVLGIGEDGG